MRALNPLTKRISAISMKSGTAVSAKLFMLPQVIRPIPFSPASPFCISR